MVSTSDRWSRSKLLIGKCTLMMALPIYISLLAVNNGSGWEVRYKRSKCLEDGSAFCLDAYVELKKTSSASDLLIAESMNAQSSNE